VTTARLDTEAEVARQPRGGGRLEPAEVVGHLRTLPALWADSGSTGRQALATALFTDLEVQGYQKIGYELTPEAIELGLDAALPALPEVGRQFGEFGRGERDSPATNDLPITMRLAEPPEPWDWLNSA
jgi:hypothetical protein